MARSSITGWPGAKVQDGSDLVRDPPSRKMGHASCPPYVHFLAPERCLGLCFRAGRRLGSRLGSSLRQVGRANRPPYVHFRALGRYLGCGLFRIEAWILFGDPPSGKSSMQIVLFTCTLHLGDVYDSVSVLDRGPDLVWRSSLKQLRRANCPLYVYFRALGRGLRFCFSAGQRPGSRLEILSQASRSYKLSSLRVLPCTWEMFTILFQCCTEAWISFGDPPSGKSGMQIVFFACTSVHLGDV